jgi:hypothetical protein
VPPFRKRQTPTKTGWQPVSATGLRATGAEPGCCERCGRRDLRFLYVVGHPDEGRCTSEASAPSVCVSLNGKENRSPGILPKSKIGEAVG